MLLAAGAGRTMGPNAGLAHLGERTFEGRPQLRHVGQKDFAGKGVFLLHIVFFLFFFFFFHIVCISKYIHTCQAKNVAPPPAPTRRPGPARSGQTCPNCWPPSETCCPAVVSGACPPWPRPASMTGSSTPSSLCGI